MLHKKTHEGGEHMEKVVLTEEMIKDMVIKEVECEKDIDDKDERRTFSDMITDLESRIYIEAYKKGLKDGFDKCLKLIGGGTK